MVKDRWLPNGHKLTDKSIIRSLLFSGNDWQIYNTRDAGNVLIAHSKLAYKWCDAGFLEESLLVDTTYGSKTFKSLNSHKKYAMVPVECGESPSSKVDAIAFSLALKESRKISNKVSFHDSIYVEQFSRLLPTWSLTPHIDDQVVLGTWITGGVVISTESFRRLCNLTGWIPPKDLAEIISAAGIYLPPNSFSHVGIKSNSRIQYYKNAENPIIKGQQGNIEVPEVKTDHRLFCLPGRPMLENFFNEHVIDIINNSEKYQNLGIDFPSAIVLHGPPGCGKTFAVERLAEFFDWPNYSIDSNSVGSPYIHETSKKISEIFDKAIESSPSIIVIDEMETFLSDRRSGGTANMHHVEEVSEFLRRIPEALVNKVLIIAMTNAIELIDPAILRRGRFDHIIKVGMPLRMEVASLLSSLLSKIPKSDDLNLDALLDELTGKPLSDSAFVIRESARIAAKNGKAQIDQESLIAALGSFHHDKEKKNRPIGFALDS